MHGQWKFALESEGRDPEGISLQAFSLLECLKDIACKKKSFKTWRKQKIENVGELDTT